MRHDIPATNGTSSCNNVITRTYQGVDASGNVGFCAQTITLNVTDDAVFELA